MPSLPFNNELPPTPLLVFSCSLGKVSGQWVENENWKSLSIQADYKLLASRPNFPFNIRTLQGSHDSNKALHNKVLLVFENTNETLPSITQALSWLLLLFPSFPPPPLECVCVCVREPEAHLTHPPCAVSSWFPSSPLQCLSDFLPCLAMGSDVIGRRGLVFRGECAPWTLIHKDPCVRASPLSLCPTYTYSLVYTKKPPKHTLDPQTEATE